MEVTHVAEDGDRITVTWQMTREEYDVLVGDAQREVDDAKDDTDN